MSPQSNPGKMVPRHRTALSEQSQDRQHKQIKTQAVRPSKNHAEQEKDLKQTGDVGGRKKTCMAQRCFHGWEAPMGDVPTLLVACFLVIFVLQCQTPGI